MDEFRILGILVRFRHGVPPFALTNLRATLGVVPPEHREEIRQIDVVPPSWMGEDPHYAGGGSGLGYPRLSRLCFDRRYRSGNFPLNLTLLHEIGHVLDRLHACTASLTPEHRAVIGAIPIPANARTHGPGEHYAIAYQQVMAGGASEAVRAAVFSSTAFSGVDTGDL